MLACSVTAGTAGAQRSPPMVVRLRRPDGAVRTLGVGSTTDVGRLDVGEKFSHISRRQASVTVTERNVVLVSHGANPTGVRLGASAPWRWLKKGEDATVGHSAQICLDRKQHSSVEALLTLEPEATPITEAAPPAPSTEAVPPPPAPAACTDQLLGVDARCGSVQWASCHPPRAA